MNTNRYLNRAWTRAAAVACFVACLGDFAVSFVLGLLLPGYNSLQEPESFLGSSDSPVAGWVTLWGVIFTGLLTFFALGLREALGSGRRSVTLLATLIIVYGVGEGMLSGLFHYDFVNGALTLQGKIHRVAGIAGQTGLYVVPLVAWYALHREYPAIKVLSILVLVAGSIFLLLFNASKLYQISFRGLWQRLFMGVYFAYLMYLALLTYRQAGKMQPQRSA